MRVEDGVNEIVYSCSEILLQYVCLEVLVEVELIFAVDYAFHCLQYLFYYIISL